jgi:hypothetical protein
MRPRRRNYEHFSFHVATCRVEAGMEWDLEAQKAPRDLVVKTASFSQIFGEMFVSKHWKNMVTLFLSSLSTFFAEKSSFVDGFKVFFLP